MLYRYLWFVLTLGYIAVFQRFYIINRQKFPKKGPVLLTPNHINAFMDAIVLAATSTRDLNFLTRGDIFKNKVTAYFLRALHQVPIFRPRDGIEQMKNNTETFKEVFKRLSENRVVLIFPEGDCVQKKRLRTPLKKGTVRMALDFMNAYNWQRDLAILPVGNNYATLASFRGDLQIVYGDPIQLKDYKAIYDENPNKAIRLLNQEIQKRMKDCLVEYPVGKEGIAETLYDIHHSEYPSRWGWLHSSDKKFLREKALMQSIFETENAALQEKIETYNKAKKKLEVSEFDLSHKKAGILHWLFAIFSTPVALPFFILHYPLYAFATNKAKQMVKNIEFYFSVRLGLLVVLYTLVSFLLFFGLIWTNIWAAILAPIGFYLGGILAISWKLKWELVQKTIRFRKVQTAQDGKEMLKLRSELIAFIDKSLQKNETTLDNPT